MEAGIFQSEREFDKYDVQVRRNYLAIDKNGNVALTNMPDSRSPSYEEILRSQNCLHGESHFSGSETFLQFKRAEVTLQLVLRLDGADIHITDPQEDEFGGWGGTYRRAAK